MLFHILISRHTVRVLATAHSHTRTHRHASNIRKRTQHTTTLVEKTATLCVFYQSRWCQNEWRLSRFSPIINFRMWVSWVAPPALKISMEQLYVHSVRECESGEFCEYAYSWIRRICNYSLVRTVIAVYTQRYLRITNENEWMYISFNEFAVINVNNRIGNNRWKRKHMRLSY